MFFELIDEQPLERPDRLEDGQLSRRLFVRGLAAAGAALPLIAARPHSVAAAPLAPVLIYAVTMPVAIGIWEQIRTIVVVENPERRGVAQPIQHEVTNVEYGLMDQGLQHIRIPPEARQTYEGTILQPDRVGQARYTVTSDVNYRARTLRVTA